MVIKFEDIPELNRPFVVTGKTPIDVDLRPGTVHRPVEGYILDYRPKGRKPAGGKALTPAEKQKAYRVRKKGMVSSGSGPA